MPVEAVLLLALVDGAAEKLLQHVEVAPSPSVNASGNSAFSCSMFSATMSADLVSGSSAVSFFIVSSFFTVFARAAAWVGLDALEFQVQFHLPRHLLLFRGRGAQAGDLRVQPRAFLQGVAPGRRVFGDRGDAKAPVTRAAWSASSVSIQP